MAIKKKQATRDKAITNNHWHKVPSSISPEKYFSFPSSTELKPLILFLLLCICTLAIIDVMPAPSEKQLNLLGITPPLQWLNIVLAVYLSSEIVLVLSRNRQTNTDRFAWQQILFLSCFIFFYWTAGALQQHFILLFCCGVILQLGEAFTRANSTYFAEEDSV